MKIIDLFHDQSQFSDLIGVSSDMTEEERESAYTVLEAIPSTAKGKKTYFTKAHLRTLKKEIDG